MAGWFGKSLNDEFRFKDDEKEQEKQKMLISKIEELDIIKKLHPCHNELTNLYRNDINHAGFGRKEKVAVDFEKALDRIYKKTKNIIKES